MFSKFILYATISFYVLKCIQDCLDQPIMTIGITISVCLLFKFGGGNNQSEAGASSKADLVRRIKAKLAAHDPAKARELGGVFLFNIIRGTSVYSWTMDLNNVTVYEGEPEADPDCTVTLSEHNFKQLVLGKEDARIIMQAGRCSVTGDIMRAMKLEPYIKIE